MRILGIGLAVWAVMTTVGMADDAKLKSDHWYSQNDNGAWCSYANGKAWRAVKAYDFAEGSVINGEARWLSVIQNADSGDWVVFDIYNLDHEALTTLERTYNTFDEGGISLVETYIMQSDKWKRTSRKMFTLKNHRRVKDIADFTIPGKPVIRLSDFGFYKVLDKKPKSGRLCTKL